MFIHLQHCSEAPQRERERESAFLADLSFATESLEPQSFFNEISKTAFSKTSFSSASEARMVMRICSFSPLPKMHTMRSRSSFGIRRSSSGDGFVSPEWPARNNDPTGVSPTSKLRASDHHNNRWPCSTTNTSNHAMSDAGETAPVFIAAFARLFSRNRAWPYQVACHSFWSRDVRFANACSSIKRADANRLCQKYVFRKSSLVGKVRMKLRNHTTMNGGLGLSPTCRCIVPLALFALFFAPDFFRRFFDPCLRAKNPATN
mmetsp:Transcript_9857/g.26916  ORF Transcript_9857/g.26916 Transcript_9857/m.26916 type:complete len:261 (-) Transcript_9857:1404-2186(-)